MSLILHIDTSAENGIYFLSEQGKCIARSETEGKNDHAVIILDTINDLLKSIGKNPEHISSIDVCAGPGSYTGLRIGLSTAKGLCYALSKPLMMTHKLLLLAETLRAQDDGRHQFYAAIIPARQNEFYTAIINKDGDTLQAPKHVSIADLKQMLNIYGPDLILTTENPVSEEFRPYENQIINYDLEIWSLFAAQNEKARVFSDLKSAEPFYLKAPFVTQPKTI